MFGAKFQLKGACPGEFFTLFQLFMIISVCINLNRNTADKMAGADSKPCHLGPNNFTIGHDDRVTKPSLMSVFKNDYPVHNQYGRAEIAKPPRLGDVMHKDERLSERASETVMTLF